MTPVEIARVRTGAMIVRARANAEFEANECVRLARGIDLAADPQVPLGQAESLVRAAASLVRYLSALDALESVSGLMEDA